MATRKKSCREQIGRGRRHQDPGKKLIQEVAATKKRSLAACHEYKLALRKAQQAGVDLPQSVVEPILEVRRNEIHILSDLDHPDHRHTVVRLPEGLSRECLAELADKITNGKVSYSRPQGEEHGWWNYYPTSDLLIAEMAAG